VSRPITSRAALAPRAGALMTVVSMATAQLGVAASVRFLSDLGPLGAAWIRLAWSGLIIVVVVRPWRIRYSRPAIRAGLVLGVATAGMCTFFMFAATHIPLGTASALEFMGPLTVAAFHGRQRRSWVWPLLAVVGVLLLTQPWSGNFDLVGVAFALAGACCYAAYILFTQRIGDEADGLEGLAISLPVAAVLSTLVAVPSTAPRLDLEHIAIGLLLALMVPFVPFLLELLALRRLTAAAFATLMALEPACALLVGLVLLGQVPDAMGIVGMVCVAAAGIGAVRVGARPQPAPIDAAGDVTVTAPAS
jgi:inner membrane transporter RhtA